MGAGFTPGPWSFVPWHVEEGPSAVRAPEGWLIATTSSDANARFIAAAPELYEALEGLLATHKQGKGQCCDAADKAIDALAKARGEA